MLNAPSTIPPPPSAPSPLPIPADPAPAATGQPTAVPAPQATIVDSVLAISLGLLAVVFIVVAWKRKLLTPTSPAANSTPRDISAFLPLEWVIVLIGSLVVAFALVPAAVVGIATYFGHITTPHTPAEDYIRDPAVQSFTALGTLVGAVIVWFFLQHGPRLFSGSSQFQGFAWLRPRMGPILTGLLLFLPITIIVLATSSLCVFVTTLFSQPPNAIAHELLRQLSNSTYNRWTIPLILSAALVAPIAEELLFRGLLQTTLLRATGRPWLSILITSALFTSVHISAADPASLPPLFVLSIALGLALERSKNLLTCITIHAGFNAFNLALTYILYVAPPAQPVP